MAGKAFKVQARPSDSEKITINLGYVDLGHVDLIVQEGFYSNRTDFIRTAIRNQLDRHADVTRKSIARRTLDLGLRTYGREELETVRRAGETLEIKVLGLATMRAMSPRRWLARPFRRSPCWVPCMRAPRSAPHSPTGCDRPPWVDA
jgi:Arc/MetJ-type ribon-helix-helix transcriptional regulator